MNRTIGVATQTAWRQVVKKFERPHHGRAIWQIIQQLRTLFHSLGPHGLEFLDLYWLTLALMVPAVGFLIRIFIIFHDCCHGSFFRSARANEVVGTVQACSRLRRIDTGVSPAVHPRHGRESGLPGGRRRSGR
ncbi:MAG: hypothetical protein R3E12_01710 [Candidatus Eisenbacteria bacterium]